MSGSIAGAYGCRRSARKTAAALIDGCGSIGAGQRELHKVLLAGLRAPLLAGPAAGSQNFKRERPQLAPAAAVACSRRSLALSLAGQGRRHRSGRLLLLQGHGLRPLRRGTGEKAVPSRLDRHHCDVAVA